MYDMIIIGAGPAGLSAAIYAQRAGLNAVTLEKKIMSGGRENYGQKDGGTERNGASGSIYCSRYPS